MPETYHCPHCQAPIEAGDVNVATDLALCRRCERTSSFAAMVDANQWSKIDLLHPPQYVTFGGGDFSETAIVYRRRHKGALAFLIIFTMLWSGISLSALYGPQIANGKLDAGQALFGLPFLGGTLVMLGFIMFLLFGAWTIRLAGGEGSVFVGVGRLGWNRTFNYDRTTVVSLQDCGASVNDQPKKAITVQTGERKLHFAAFIDEESKQYIAALLRQAISTS